MTTMRRPLTNAEQVYRSVYIDLCALYVAEKHDEAEELAWRFYQDPHIPLILRIMCCNVLGEALDGEYLRFAREAVEHATAALALEPENEIGRLMLEESREILKDAEEDAKEALLELPDLLRECDKTATEADELAAELAARDATHSDDPHSQPSNPSAPALPGSEV